MAKAPPEIRSLARTHTDAAINTLAGIMNQPKAPPAARVAAAEALLNRGWGKPTQVLAGDDEGGPIKLEQIKRVIFDPRDSDSPSIPPAPGAGEI